MKTERAGKQKHQRKAKHAKTNKTRERRPTRDGRTVSETNRETDMIEREREVE